MMNLILSFKFYLIYIINDIWEIYDIRFEI